MASGESQSPSPADGAERTVSLRWSLIRNLCLLIVFLTGTILLSTIYTGSRIRDAMSTALIDRALGQVQADLRGFLTPVERSLLLTRDLLEAGVITLDDRAGLNRVFVPLIREIAQVSSVNIGDAEGRGYLLLRLEDRWRNRETWVERWGDRLEFHEWNEDRELKAWSVDQPGEAERYDPRVRDWYRVVDDARAGSGPDRPVGGVRWTKPYRFFTTGEPGMTAAVTVTDSDGRELVLAFDVLLRDLTHFTQRLDVSPNGIGFVLDSTFRLLGLPRLPELASDEAQESALLRRPEELGIPLLDAGSQRIAAHAADARGVFHFVAGDETYWVRNEATPLGENNAIYVVAAVPERDLLGAVNEQRLLLLAAAVLGFGVAVAMAFWLARRYGTPLAILAKNSERIAALDLGVITPVKSEVREVHQLATEQERMRIALDSFSRYVPVEIVRELMNRGEAARIGGERREVTALFTDVRSYTSISEGMSPEQLTAHMAEYFEELLGIVQGDGFGTVTQLNGDGMIAFWGAPTATADHASLAARAVLRCQSRLRELASDWQTRGLPALPTRFGLATGPVVIGNVGASSRLVYTALGDTMNLASRLEGLGRFYGASSLVAESTRVAAGPDFLWRRVDAVRVKGKQEAVEVFELLGLASEVSEARRTFAAAYETALQHFREGEFDASVAQLERLFQDHPEDPSVQRLLELARRYSRVPPHVGWDGVSEFEVK